MLAELTIYGRGGQGGVTLAKLIATAFFLRDKHVQAFGVYAAERSGAPLQAFVRIDDNEITNHNQIKEPDHIIVLDRTLISRRVLTGLKPDGNIVLNTTEEPEAFAELFAGRNVLTVDATAIALANGLGTKTVPIVNTTLLGAIAGVLGLSLEDVEAALAETKFIGPNVTSARQAFEAVRAKRLAGELVTVAAVGAEGAPAGFFDEAVGAMPRIKTGDWATRAPDRHRLEPPCNDGCPAGNDVRGFVESIGREDCNTALAILMETSPFPGVCGRVCPAPCMEVCNRNEHDEGVNIRELERFAADHGQRPAITKPTRAERIAVVGSGPGGLSATYHLARLGYPVTLLEADKELGGVMRTGIPSYRLPRDVLDSEISHIVRHGVEVRTETRVGREELLGLSHEFAAVFVATGLQHTRGMKLGESAVDMVEEGIDFLDRVRLGKESLLDMDVVVVGGGNTAVDAARSALRVGARSVRIVYRRTRAEMPAIIEEIEEALEEGIVLDELVMPLRLRCESGAGARVPAAGARNPTAGARIPAAGARIPPAGARIPPAGARIPSRTTAATGGGRYDGPADATPDGRRAGTAGAERHAGGGVLTCQRMELGEPDESGRPRPIPAKTEDAQFDISCDRVLLALGQSADLSILPEGSEIKDDRLCRVGIAHHAAGTALRPGGGPCPPDESPGGDQLLGLSGAPIFAGGDLAVNEGTVTAAIGSGRRAAWHIHRTLTGEDLFAPPRDPIATPERIAMHIFSHSPREDGAMVDPKKRRGSFTEVRLGLIDEPAHNQAVEEARRCFSCGVCNQCDRCITYCPEGIVVRSGDEYCFDNSYCKGCGICASQCPRGVIFMAEL